jgi:hypothetical protein
MARLLSFRAVAVTAAISAGLLLLGYRLTHWGN